MGVKGVDSAVVDLDKGTVTVISSKLNEKMITEAITDAGYDVVG
jgi:copper chaperone CopZ